MAVKINTYFYLCHRIISFIHIEIMTSLELAKDWLSLRNIEYEYDEHMDVVRIQIPEGKAAIYTIPEYNLFCISHSEAMAASELSERERKAIISVMQDTAFVRPVPREDRKRIKFKIVVCQRPDDVCGWIDKSIEDLSKGIKIFRNKMA